MFWLLPHLVVAVATCAPSAGERAGQIMPEGRSAPALIIAQKHGGADPHGEDPHGDDPHDEQHDSGLPANKDGKKYKAPKDVYGGDVPNDQSPYPPL